MPIYRQEFTLHLECEQGNLYETTLTLNSDSKFMMPPKESVPRMTKVIKDYCSDAGRIKLVGLAINESVTVDFVLP